MRITINNGSWSKNFFCFEERVSKNKGLCIQLDWFKPSFFYDILNLDFTILGGGAPFSLIFRLFGDFFHFQLSWFTERDHAGLEFNITLLGLTFMINLYDVRHWDYDNDTWEVYPVTKTEEVTSSGLEHKCEGCHEDCRDCI